MRIPTIEAASSSPPTARIVAQKRDIAGGPAVVVEIADVAETFRPDRPHLGTSDLPRVIEDVEAEADDLAEREGGDRQVQAPHPERREPHQKADEGADDGSQQERRKQRETPQSGRDSGEIGADGVEPLLAEGDLPGQRDGIHRQPEEDVKPRLNQERIHIFHLRSGRSHYW
jgi:hypothetical protein